uniref:hypothetical protein n=1 Tax=Alloprevotella sp. TaxID=1872471 RepID=UPI00402A169B
GLHITLAISNSFFRENINVQKPKREARLNVPSLVKLGCGSEEQNESFLTFILLFAHLALTLFPNK